jgi:ABC-type uncharacterized transport system fused permease/ATPase subunit
MHGLATRPAQSLAALLRFPVPLTVSRRRSTSPGSYYQSVLALEWRQWMTERLLRDYMADRTFYGLQQSADVDNPDQRISSDVA